MSKFAVVGFSESLYTVDYLLKLTPNAVMPTIQIHCKAAAG